jgi:hypothetical protein
MVGTFYMALAQLAHAKGNPEAVTTYLHEAQTLCQSVS